MNTTNNCYNFVPEDIKHRSKYCEKGSIALDPAKVVELGYETAGYLANFPSSSIYYQLCQSELGLIMADINRILGKYNHLMIMPINHPVDVEFNLYIAMQDDKLWLESLSNLDSSDKIAIFLKKQNQANKGILLT